MLGPPLAARDRGVRRVDGPGPPGRLVTDIAVAPAREVEALNLADRGQNQLPAEEPEMHTVGGWTRRAEVVAQAVTLGVPRADMDPHTYATSSCSTWATLQGRKWRSRTTGTSSRARNSTTSTMSISPTEKPSSPHWATPQAVAVSGSYATIHHDPGPTGLYSRTLQSWAWKPAAST